MPKFCNLPYGLSIPLGLALVAALLAVMACSADSTEELAPAMVEEGVTLPTVEMVDTSPVDELLDKWSEPVYPATPVVPATGDVVDPETGEVLDINTAIEQACAKVDTSNYDATQTWWIGEDGEDGHLVTKYEVSGEDLRAVSTFYVIGFFPVSKREDILKDGVSYARENVRGKPETMGDWQIEGPIDDLIKPDPCSFLQDQLTGMRRVGPRHFALKEGAAVEEGVEEVEVWLDERGLVLQGFVLTEAGRFDAVYSDIGVPNVITAPVNANGR